MTMASQELLEHEAAWSVTHSVYNMLARRTLVTDILAKAGHGLYNLTTTNSMEYALLAKGRTVQVVDQMVSCLHWEGETEY